MQREVFVGCILSFTVQNSSRAKAAPVLGTIDLTIVISNPVPVCPSII